MVTTTILNNIKNFRKENTQKNKIIYIFFYRLKLYRHLTKFFTAHILHSRTFRVTYYRHSQKADWSSQIFIDDYSFMTQKKIALFGGTFDPIHLGHTTVAASAARHIEADEVIFIPAKLSPLKGFYPQASDTDRLAMTALAIAEEKKFSLSKCELDRAVPSFTLDTVRYFLDKYGSGTQIYWLTGADNIDDLNYWYEIITLLDLCNLATMYRAGCEKPQFKKYEPLWGTERIEKLQRNIIPTPLVDISSTEIRNQLAAGQDVSQMLHPAVLSYILKHNLYQHQKDKTNDR